MNCRMSSILHSLSSHVIRVWKTQNLHHMLRCEAAAICDDVNKLMKSMFFTASTKMWRIINKYKLFVKITLQRWNYSHLHWWVSCYHRCRHLKCWPLKHEQSHVFIKNKKSFKTVKEFLVTINVYVNINSYILLNQLQLLLDPKVNVLQGRVCKYRKESPFLNHATYEMWFRWRMKSRNGIAEQRYDQQLVLTSVKINPPPPNSPHNEALTITRTSRLMRSKALKC